MNSDTWCRHFTGIQYPECKAGISYQSVKVEGERPLKLPCHGQQVVCSCAKYEPHTPEELAEHARKITEAVKHLMQFEQRLTNVCPHCGRTVTALEQVGRSVYTSCGCRLWQGKVPKAWVS